MYIKMKTKFQIFSFPPQYERLNGEIWLNAIGGEKPILLWNGWGEKPLQVFQMGWETKCHFAFLNDMVLFTVESVNLSQNIDSSLMLHFYMYNKSFKSLSLIFNTTLGFSPHKLKKTLCKVENWPHLYQLNK